MPSIGRITQVIGPAVDRGVAPTGTCPRSTTPSRITNPAIDDRPWNLVVEVALHLGRDPCDTIAMDSTDGLTTRQEVRDTGDRHPVAGRRATLGRIMNVVGERSTSAGRSRPRNATHPSRGPGLHDQETQVQAFETGSRCRTSSPPTSGAGRSAFGGRRRGKTVIILELINNVAKQHGGVVARFDAAEFGWRRGSA